MAETWDGELQGDAPRERVDDLVAAFNTVCGKGVPGKQRIPRLISLEAPSGWGKSRIVHEFYARLAADQDGYPYWPPTLLDGADATRHPDHNRKRTHPVIVGADMRSLPEWFWWGIACTDRTGTPIETLTADIAQYSRAAAALHVKWRATATPGQRFWRTVSGSTGREIGESVMTEAVGAGIEMIVKVTAPGVGVLLDLTKMGWRKLRGADGGDGLIDPVTEIHPAVVKVAKEIVPVVIFVEDLHLAEASLVGLLTRLLNVPEAPILVVTTAWPGEVDHPGRPSKRLFADVRPERVERWSSRDESAKLPPMSTEDRQILARSACPDFTDPELGPAVHAAIADRFSTPLEIGLVCESDELRLAARGIGADALSVVAGLPDTIQGLYRMLWDELPREVRVLCMLGALATPRTVAALRSKGAEGSDMDLYRGVDDGDAHWDPEIAAACLVGGHIDWLRQEVGELEASLASQANAYGWARSITGWVYDFASGIQHEVAAAAAHSMVHGGDKEFLSGFFTTLADHFDANHEDSERAALHTRMLLVLEAEGFIPKDARWLEAIERRVIQLLEAPDAASARLARYLANAAIGAASAAGDSVPLVMLSAVADTSYELGLMKEALAAYERLLAAQRGVLSNDDSEIWGSQIMILWCLSELDLAVARQRGLEYLDEQRCHSAGPSVVLATRSALAFIDFAAGRIQESYDTYGEIIQAYEHGADPEDRQHLLVVIVRRAMAALRLGRRREALRQCRDAVEWSSKMDPSEVSARRRLLLRNELTTIVGDCGFPRMQVSLCQALLDDVEDTLGDEHPEALTVRNNMAYALGQSGNHERAIEVLESLVEDRARLLGEDASLTMISHYNLANNYLETGRFDEAVALFDLVVSSGVFPVPSRDHFMTRCDRTLARLLGNSSNSAPAGATAQHREIRAEMNSIISAALDAYGPDDEVVHEVVEYSRALDRLM